MDRLISDLLQQSGGQHVHGLILTADGGYGKLSLLKKILKHGVRRVFIITFE